MKKNQKQIDINTILKEKGVELEQISIPMNIVALLCGVAEGIARNLQERLKGLGVKHDNLNQYVKMIAWDSLKFKESAARSMGHGKEPGFGEMSDFICKVVGMSTEAKSEAQQALVTNSISQALNGLHSDEMIELCQGAFEAARDSETIGGIGGIKEYKFESFEDWLQLKQ